MGFEQTIAHYQATGKLGGGGLSWWSSWSVSGTHYLVSSNRSAEAFAIEDIDWDGFSRVVAQAPKDSKSTAYEARWAPDGSRFVFALLDDVAHTSKLMLSNASGGPAIKIADLGKIGARIYSWSPDGQWFAAVGIGSKGKPQVVKIKTIAGATPVPLTNADLDLVGQLM